MMKRKDKKAINEVIEYFTKRFDTIIREFSDYEDVTSISWYNFSTWAPDLDYENNKVAILTAFYYKLLEVDFYDTEYPDGTTGHFLILPLPKLQLGVIKTSTSFSEEDYECIHNIIMSKFTNEYDFANHLEVNEEIINYFKDIVENECHQSDDDISIYSAGLDSAINNFKLSETSSEDTEIMDLALKEVSDTLDNILDKQDDEADNPTNNIFDKIRNRFKAK